MCSWIAVSVYVPGHLLKQLSKLHCRRPAACPGAPEPASSSGRREESHGPSLPIRFSVLSADATANFTCTET